MNWFSEHFSKWNLVWFCLIFWGSILYAALTYFLESSLILAVFSYSAGLVLGREVRPQTHEARSSFADEAEGEAATIRAPANADQCRTNQEDARNSAARTSNHP